MILWYCRKFQCMNMAGKGPKHWRPGLQDQHKADLNWGPSLDPAWSTWRMVGSCWTLSSNKATSPGLSSPVGVALTSSFLRDFKNHFCIRFFSMLPWDSPVAWKKLSLPHHTLSLANYCLLVASPLNLIQSSSPQKDWWDVTWRQTGSFCLAIWEQKGCVIEHKAVAALPSPATCASLTMCTT